LSPTSFAAADVMEFIIYRIITFFYLIIGIVSNFILLIAFYKQSKTEKAYGYQVVFTVSKTFEIFSFGTYLLAGKWFFALRLEWFMTNHALISYFVIGLGLHVSFIISTLLLAIAMAADRLFAVMKPVMYKKTNHLWHQIIAYIGCFAIGFLGGGMYFADVKFKDGKNGFYEPYFDQELEHALTGQIFFYVRLITRVGGVIILIILNTIMIFVFRKHMAKVNAAVAGLGGDNNKIEKSATEKMLLWINIFQACLMLVNQIPHTLWQVLLFAMPPAFETCEGKFVGPICDGLVMITDTLDFFVVIAINKKMRRLILNAFPCLSGFGKTTTVVEPFYDDEYENQRRRKNQHNMNKDF
jgi:hypothetical protein